MNPVMIAETHRSLQQHCPVWGIKGTKQEVGMKELIRFIRALYIICINSEKKEITVDDDTLKLILDDLKKIDAR